MRFDVFFNFAGDCNEALDFYAGIFKEEVQDKMTFAESGDPTVAEADKDLILYASMKIFGCTVMFCDVPRTEKLIVGNNVSPTLSHDSGDEIVRLFTALGEGGKTLMELQKTFFSPQFGIAQDKFGIIWQLSTNEA